MASAPTRRELLQGAGALGLAAALPAPGCSSVPVGPAQPKPLAGARVPLRPFGRSGTYVSSLALGGYFDALARQDLLARAVELGITYWETTLSYGGSGYGQFFRSQPAARERVFLLAKSQGATLAPLARQEQLRQLDRDLETALQQLGRSYIDFFTIGALTDETALNDDVRGWVERAKAAGKLRYFGFSTHANMIEHLTLASTLDWIDGVMTVYNYRLMMVPELEAALAACARRGIAITAIKSQALDTNPAAAIGEDTAAAQQALARHAGRSADLYQARLQAVWSNPAIASICSMMLTPEALEANSRTALQAGSAAAGATAALGLSSLAAERGQGRYCLGCSRVCESRTSEPAPIADVMRLLMYARSYGDTPRARAELAALGAPARAALARANYQLAEACCPQQLPIARLMHEALQQLG
jgi:predicted aldo/keto reductase-like oxidoreductase